MAMTKLEVAAKDQILDVLIKEGRPSYARLLTKMELNLTNDPSVIAYMIPDKAKIVINQNLTIKQVSTIVRHEILHEYLTHMQRSNAWKDNHKDRSDIYNNPNFRELTNIAGDFEISNKGYTDDDKRTARSIVLGDKILRGLVTEDQFPGWENLSFEEMLDKLVEQIDDIKDLIQRSKEFNNTGDQNIQDAEEVERQANAAIDDLGNETDQSKQSGKGTPDNSKDGKASSGKSNSDKDDQQKAKDIAKQAGKLKQAAKANQDSDNPIRSDQQAAKDAAIKKRVDELRKEMDEISKEHSLENEDSTILNKEKAAKASKELKRYRESPMKQFLTSLANFIKREVAYGRDASWSRINRTHLDTGIVRPGVSNTAASKIPLINVYFDRSGSWNDQSKSEVGYRAVSSLNQYVRQGKLKVKLYYFSNSVCSSEQEALSQGGTDGQPIMDHIEQTKPDNVIIITDSDITDIRGQYSVPGGVWLVFVGGVSDNLRNSLRGKKLTRSFELGYGRNY